MKSCFPLIVGLFVLLSSCSSAFGASNPQEVQVQYQDWHDGKRERDIPVKLYLPQDLRAPRPVVVFSHGLGGSREAAIYLGNHLAEHGYIGVFIQHPGSDESFWKPSLKSNEQIPDRSQLIARFRQQVLDPAHAVNRAHDVHFVIDELESINKTDPVLKGKVDLGAIAIAGHSYGSWTALTASGQRLITPAGREVSSADPRIKAAIYLSPTSPRKGQDPSAVYGNIKIPGLHFTGTLDITPVNDTKAEERRIAFDNITLSDQYLVILDGADHIVFNGRPRITQKAEDKLQHEIIKKTTTAFLDAYLKHDRKAKTWLQTTASTVIKPNGTYEFKVAKQ